ncbi:MAG: EamA/RhaT family transporter, partial [Pyrobaculum sp.]
MSLKIFVAAFLWSTIGVAATYGRDVIWLAFFRSFTASLISLTARPSRRGLVPGLLLGGLFSVYPLAAVSAGVGGGGDLPLTGPRGAT